VEPLHDYAGRTDTHGNPLAVTAPAVADEIAAAADLVKGKLGGTPVAVLRGLAGLVLPVGEHGAGATVLVRPEEHDMFGLGAREAVLAAFRPDAGALRGFGAAARAGHLADALRRVAATAGPATGNAPSHARARVVVHGDDEVTVELSGDDLRTLGHLEGALGATAVAHGWQLHAGAPAGDETGVLLRLRPRTP